MLIVRVILLCVTVAISLMTAILDYGKNDRRTRQYRRRRVALIALTCMFLLVSVGAEVAAHRQAVEADRNADRRHAHDAAEILKLREAIKAEELAHRRESSQAMGALDTLQQRLADLQAKVTTAELRAELQRYALELRSTREALSPPRAALTAYFGDISDPDAYMRTARLQRRGRQVNVVLRVRNDSRANADNGFVWFRMCERCEVLEPPAGLRHLEGAHAGEYTVSFTNVGPNVALGGFQFRIRVPPEIGAIGIGFKYSCQTCKVETDWETLTATVLPEFDFDREGRRKPGA